MDELDPRRLQAREVDLRPAPVEVVAGDDVPVGVPRREREGGAGPDEAGAAGDEDAHDLAADLTLVRCVASASSSAGPTPRRGARPMRCSPAARRARPARRSRMPRLPAEPYDRKYGLRVGRPVDRVYIEDFLERHAARHPRARAGDPRPRLHRALRRRPRGALGRPRRRARQRPRRRCSGDLESGAGLPREAFDCFICTQTLSLIYDVRAAVANAHALLKPGGVFLVTVPGISQQADPAAEEFPDYWRFTKLALERLLREHFEEVAVEAHGTVAATGAFLYGVPAAEVDPATLGPHDPDYELVVCGRAVRSA